MQCPQCGLEPIIGAVFCGNCGSRLQLRCENCDTTNPSNSNFCYSCGKRLDSGQNLGRLEARDTRPVTLAVECPRCHAANEPGSVYCFSCGLPLEGTPAASRSSSIGEPAGFWIRLGAYLLDAIILITFDVILTALLQADFFSDEFGIFDLLSFLSSALYFTLSVGIWGTTLGKRAFRLYVIRMDDSKVGIGRAFARYLSYFVSAFAFGIGFLAIAFRRDKRGLHDLICDTQVVRRYSNTRPYA